MIIFSDMDCFSRQELFWHGKQLKEGAAVPSIIGKPLPEHFHRRCFWFSKHFGYAVDRVFPVRDKRLWEPSEQRFSEMDASGWNLEPGFGALYPIEFNQTADIFNAGCEDDKEILIALERDFKFLKAGTDVLASFLSSWDWDGISRFGFQKFEFLDFLYEFGFHGIMNWEHGSDKMKGFLSIGLFQEHMGKIDVKKPLIAKCDGQSVKVTEND